MYLLLNCQMLKKFLHLLIILVSGVVPLLFFLFYERECVFDWGLSSDQRVLLMVTSAGFLRKELRRFLFLKKAILASATKTGLRWLILPVFALSARILRMRSKFIMFLDLSFGSLLKLALRFRLQGKNRFFMLLSDLFTRKIYFLWTSIRFLLKTVQNGLVFYWDLFIERLIFVWNLKVLKSWGIIPSLPVLLLNLSFFFFLAFQIRLRTKLEEELLLADRLQETDHLFLVALSLRILKIQLFLFGKMLLLRVFNGSL
jgi:hypothetical protein